MTEVSTLVALSRPTTTVTKSTTTATSGSETLPISDTSDILIGMKVSGTNIEDNTIVTAISTNTNITMSREASGSGATGTLTFTRTAFDVPTNPQLCVSATSPSSNGSTVDNFGVAIIEENSGSINLTAVGRTTLGNCDVTQNSPTVTLSSGNTNGLYVGQSVQGTGFATENLPQNKVARIKMINSSTEFTLTEKATTSATGATFVLGIEHRNLEVTEGIRIKCFDDTTQTGVRLNSIDLTTTHLFVMIHSDDENKHHFAKVSEIFTDDISGDAFEFRPKLGNEIAKNVKFKLYSTPIPTDKTIAAIGLGIKNSLSASVSVARPLFYFFNENLDKKNELDHNKKYNMLFSELDFVAVSATSDAINTRSFFTTTPDFGTDIIDYSKYTLKTKLIDNLKNQDNPSTHTSNEGETILTYTPFTSDACFTNARRDDNDTITDTASQDYNGPYRYLSYSLSKDRANIANNVIEHIMYESMGAKSSIVKLKMADPFRIISKKIGDEEPIRMRHRLFTGDFNEFKSIGAVITSNTSGNTYATTTDHDLGSYLNVGDEVRVGTRIVIVESIASISGKTQSITFRTHSRLETESIFTTGSYTLANDSVLERRAYNKKDKTLFTDFPLVSNRTDTLFVKLVSNSLSELYASVSAIDVNKKLITLSFSNKGYFDSDGSVSTEPAYHSQGTMLDYMFGKYMIYSQKMNGEIERIDIYKENSMTFIDLEARSNVRKLISPIISKNTLFSQDIIYSTQSPYNKLESVSANFTCSFANKTLTSSGSITLTAGTKVHLKHSSGMMSYIGEIATTVTGTSFTLVDNARAEGTTLAGYKESNKNYLLNKALATNTLVDSTTSLSGASNKGLFFNSGVKITSTGEEGDNLVGSSGSTHENAVGYEISDVQNMLSDAHFQSRLHNDVVLTGTTTSGDATITALLSTTNLFAGMEVSGTNIPTGTTVSSITNSNTLELSANATGSATGVSLTFSNKATFDTVNTLIDFEIVETKSAGENAGTLVTIAPYNPLTLGRVDINYANTQDTTFSKTNLGKTTHAFTIAKSFIEVDSDYALSAYNHIRNKRNLHDKPVYVNGKFLANIISVEKNIELEISATTAGSTQLTTTTTYLSNGMEIGDGSHTHIPNGTTVSSIESSTSLTMSASATGSSTDTTTRFSLPSTQCRIYLDREVGYVTKIGDMGIGSKVITNLNSTKELFVGMTTYHSNFTAGTTIVSIDSDTQVTMSSASLNSTINLAQTINFAFLANTVIDILEGHHNQDSTRETTKLTHNLNLLNGGHLHGGKNISLIHPVLQSSNAYNITSVLNYRMLGEQPFHEVGSNKARNFVTGDTKLDEMGTYQSNFGASNYRMTNLEKGNYSQSKHLFFNTEDIRFYEEVASKIKYYASGYRYNAGYYTDGFLQNNIIGTDICGMNIIGQGEIDTFSGSAYVEATKIGTVITTNTHNPSVFRLGQKIVAAGIPDDTFVGNVINIGTTATTARELRLTDLDGTAVNATANATNITAKFFDYDNKRLIESRGFLPSIGDKFYSPNTLETKSADPYKKESYQEGGMPSIMFTPFPSVKMFDGNGIGTEAKLRAAHQFKDKFEQIDPKIARMFLFSNSDLLPYSSTRKDSLLNVTKDRDIANYSLLTLRELTTRQHSDIKEAVKGTTQTISSFDDSYISHDIVSVNDDKKINQLRRFSIMRLTEIVVDCFYNQFDPENVPRNDKNIGTIAFYPRYVFSNITNSGADNIAIGSVSGTTINTVRADTGAATSANNLVQNDILVDRAGRFIGVVDSVGTNTITTFLPARKTDLATNSSADHYSPRLNQRDGSSPDGSYMELFKIDFETQQASSSSNTGVATIRGYNSENDFIESDGNINLLQGAIMRGLADDATGFPSNYVSTTTNRGNADSGYGGNSSTYTDTTFATRKGVNAIAGSVTSLTEDCSMFLPFALSDSTTGHDAYYSFLAGTIKGSMSSADSNFLTSQIFPILGKHCYQGDDVTNSQRGFTGADLFSTYSNFQDSVNKNSHRMMQNHIPVIFDRYNITGGSGAKADIGMAMPKIHNTRGVNVDGSNDKEIRFGLVNATINKTSFNKEPAGFATKVVSTDSTIGSNAPTYENDADGVFAGFKPTLKIDVGYTISATFNTTSSTHGRFIADNDDIAEHYSLGSTSDICSFYVDSEKVPKFTRGYERISGSPDEYKMTANATSTGQDTSVRISRCRVGADTATNGTTVTTLAFTDYMVIQAETQRDEFDGRFNTDNMHWLSFVDLTGCYLVSEDVKTFNPLDDTVEDYSTAGTKGIGGSHGVGSGENGERHSINNGTPNHILYVISHEIDTTRPDRTHILTVSGDFPSAASSATHFSRFKNFRIMQPNHTCFYNFSPKKITLNQLSSKYTKKPKEDNMYDNINNYLYKDRLGNREDEGNNEAVLSMYVVVDPDGQSTDGNLVVEDPLNLRGNVFRSGKVKMNISDGDNNNFTNLNFIDDGNEIGFHIELEEQKEMLGVVSVSETMEILVNGETTNFGKRAMIGSAVSVCQDADKLINEILEENDVEFNLTESSYPYFVAPNYRGIDLFSAIQFLLAKKEKTLLEENNIFTIKESKDASLFPNIFFTTSNQNTEILSYSRESNKFDNFNEIVIFGKRHKASRKNPKNIKKKGRKTLQLFENELVTQEDVDKRASELLKLHSDESYGLKLTVGHKGLSQTKVGDVVTVEIEEEDIPRSEFIITEMQHNLQGTLDLELGSYTKGLEDRFAELAIANQNINNKVREDSFNNNEISFDLLENINVKPIKLKVRKKETPAGAFTLGTNSTDSETLNTNSNALNIGVTTFTTLLEEEF